MDEKQEIRERVWRLLEERGVARFPRPVRGRIPNFVGAEEAARKILGLDEYRRARVVKVGPDSPQRAVREACLRDGKLLVMPTPRLREGFLILDPKMVPRNLYWRAATIRGAFILGRKVGLRRLPEIDLVVMGSVAVAPNGARLGKGEGYGEIEYAVLRELGKVGEVTPIATNVHDLQLLPHLPQDPYDVPVDIIATPTKLIRVRGRPPRPRGIIWERLGEEKLREIPLLKELKESWRSRSKGYRFFF